VDLAATFSEVLAKGILGKRRDPWESAARPARKSGAFSRKNHRGTHSPSYGTYLKSLVKAGIFLRIDYG